MVSLSLSAVSKVHSPTHLNSFRAYQVQWKNALRGSFEKKRALPYGCWRFLLFRFGFIIIGLRGGKEED